MSDFASIQKHLLLVPSRKDTTYNLKPLTLVPTRAIERVYAYFHLPVKQASTLGFGQKRMGWQYNFTAASAFVVVNWKYLRNRLGAFNFGTVAIRFRVGTTVTRYILAGRRDYTQTLWDDEYSGQIIQPQFVVEIWNSSGSPAGLFGVHYDSYLTLSYLSVPSTADDVGTNVEGTLKEADLFHAQPETIPTAYGTDSAWNSN